MASLRMLLEDANSYIADEYFDDGATLTIEKMGDDTSPAICFFLDFDETSGGDYTQFTVDGVEDIEMLKHFCEMTLDLFNAKKLK